MFRFSLRFKGSYLQNQIFMAAKKACESFSKSLIEEVHRWGCLKQTGVSLRYMMEFGSKPVNKNLLISAQFLHKELAIRIARRAIELENLPYGLSQKPAILKVNFFLYVQNYGFLLVLCCTFFSSMVFLVLFSLVLGDNYHYLVLSGYREESFFFFFLSYSYSSVLFVFLGCSNIEHLLRFKRLTNF